MIDVCPVGALTDKTFGFKSRVWFNKLTMLIESVRLQDVVEKQPWMFGDEIQSVTGQKMYIMK
jgi:NADH-quinone oxidoreductase subunit G